MPKAPTDALRTLEHTATAMVAAIMAEQAVSGALGGPVSLSLPSSSSPATSSASSSTPNGSQAQVKVRVELPARQVTLAELQRAKRQFVAAHKKAITLGTTEKGAVDWGEEAVAEKFARYVEGGLGV